MLSSFLLAASGSVRSQIVLRPPARGNFCALRGDDEVGRRRRARRRRRDSRRLRRSAAACSASTGRRRQAADQLLAAAARPAPTWLANSQCASTSSAGSPLISDTPLTSPGRSAWMMSLSIVAKSMTSREGIADLVAAVVEAEQADLVVAELVRGSPRRAAGSPRRPGRGAGPRPRLTALAGDFLDAVDDRQAKRAAAAVEAAEQQHGGRLRDRPRPDLRRCARRAPAPRA